MDPDPGHVGLRSVAGIVVVDLDDEPRARRNPPRHPGRDLDRRIARRPAAEPAGTVEARPAEAGVAGAGLGRVELDGASGDVEERLDVVYDFAVAGQHLGGADHPPLAGNADGHDEAAVDILRARRHREGLFHRKHGRRRAERPPGRKATRRRQIARVSLGRAIGDPARDEPDLVVREPAYVGELAVTRQGFPGRHVARLDRLHDVVTLRVRILVSGQRKRCDLARPVTGLAISLEDPDDLVVEGDAAITNGLRPQRRVRARLAGGQEEGGEQHGAPHQFPPPSPTSVKGAQKSG